MVLSSRFLSTFLLVAGARAQLQEPIIGEAEDGDSCHNACTALLNELGTIVHYGPTSELKGFSEGYQTAFQRDVVPACVVTPPTSKHVSQTISILRSYPCPIAVKSGGHATTAGMSNVAGGVTIDLRLLNTVEYLGAKDWDGTPSGKGKDRWKGQVTRVGTGNRWNRVYGELERFNVSVVGGRAGTVGVGGFILGGGISFLSQKNGWALDTIRNFEIVLPNGTLTNVNRRSNPNLFSALRGGGNNFGIVTRFDMETFPQGNLWGGYKFYLPDPAEINERREKMGVATPSPFTFDSLTHFDKVGASIVSGILRAASYFGYNPSIREFLRAFEAVVFKQDIDLHSHLFWSFSYAQQIDTYLFGGQLVHTQGKEWPEVFKPFQELKKPLWSNSRLASVAELAKEVEKWSDVGPRQAWMVTTLRTTPTSGTSTTSLHELLSLMIDIFIQEIEKIKHVAGLIPSCTFQPINMNEIRNFNKNGGNAFDIKPSEGPLVILSLTMFYESHRRRFAKDDALVRKTAESIIYRWQMMAQGHGMWHPFKYINYADGGVDVFAGYGEKQRKWLREVKKSVVGNERWDIGGFKV